MSREFLTYYPATQQPLPYYLKSKKNWLVKKLTTTIAFIFNNIQSKRKKKIYLHLKKELLIHIYDTTYMQTKSFLITIEQLLINCIINKIFLCCRYVYIAWSMKLHMSHPTYLSIIFHYCNRLSLASISHATAPTQTPKTQLIMYKNKVSCCLNLRINAPYSSTTGRGALQGYLNSNWCSYCTNRLISNFSTRKGCLHSSYTATNFCCLNIYSMW